MTTALYRRYRPEAFGEMIGQSQVTEPLMTALRSDRVGHAYLFSGPRGCGKTTSARILARCLNCAQGPTDTPCGTCDSCVELSRGGGGSLDVVEIDAASHNGVDDARDLRERAVFAPARDRFKIFILDEAHMVTAQGFNALLKLVEEPPAHVKFIFATTEPEKVIGTIRSRTHHYPFRLVAPAAMLEYVEQLCAQEGVQVEAGVLPLVVRAGGGSPRDTLSLLDQLIAGSDDGAVAYERAVALLGYTHAELLDEVVGAFGAVDAGAAFAAVDRVIQTGQDPRRFVDDLLERLRDLIIVSATGQGASAVLRGVSAEELERMGRQAALFGTDRLSRTADLVVTALDEMSGATSPRLQLELLVARVLAAAQHGVPAADQAPVAAAPASHASSPASAPAAPPRIVTPAPAQVPASAQPDRAAASPAPTAQPSAPATGAAAAASGSAAAAPAEPRDPSTVTLAQMRDAWPEVLQRLETISRTSWMIASVASPVAFSETGVLTLSFQSQSDVLQFKKLNAGKGPSEDLRGAILGVLGVRVKYVARHDSDPGGGPAPGGPTPPPAGGQPGGAPRQQPSTDQRQPVQAPSSQQAPGGQRAAGAPSAPAGGRPTATASPSGSSSYAAPVTEWAVAPIPQGDPAPQFAVDDEPEDAVAAPVRTLTAPHDGDVDPYPEPLPPIDEEDRDYPPPPVDDYAPLPPRAPVAVERPTAAPPTADRNGSGPERPAAAPVAAPSNGRANAAPARGGIERYGEAVVRQMLGATFVREEPFTSPTRFG
ncbi:MULTISPECIES: DNA polymerase III subunit gamma and tau [Microbacterium]|uniref:DNA polymerase III subunit gamma and tau n=1 Tax=Microbacterium TaxID=33882 RepID=UPI00249F3DFE|nr:MULTISPECIES: DNA polymerase III subunit gamma and tau [Microbacterium]WHE37044.1 DNA polymerase III subunit gamma and tau [Microbacterium sp. BDGP8]WRK18291.1 DNA polymerase III subunit gamma and tau [Microbacterium plantarum]